MRPRPATSPTPSAKRSSGSSRASTPTTIDVGRGSEPEVLLIDTEYQVRATNNVFDLVYPLDLEQGAA